MKWNGRSYRPVNGVPVYPKRQDSIKELLLPLSEKTSKGNVWRPILNQPVNVLKTTPTPSSVTPTPTPTPSTTPAAFDCAWSAITAQWNYNSNDWSECQPVPQITPTLTPTNTQTPTTTPTNTPTPSSTSTITSGVVDIFDAANYTSGQYWNSQLTNRRFTLYNSPTKISSYGGMISFDGVNDYALSNVSDIPRTIIPSTSDWTLEFWYTFITGSTSFLPVVMFRDGFTPPSTSTTNFVDGRNASNNRLYYLFNGTAYGPTDVMTQGTPEQVVYSYSGGTVYIYKNGSLIETQAVSYTWDNGRQSSLSWNGVDRTQCDWGLIRTYNFALNSSQVTTNFNSTKTRFGL